ncbi:MULTISPECIES: serine hydrolase domain-containing protein [unclassified Streptomyces]|uniref:serine hydrolase domain-containing protein n=1 Tax=unclassified Streptomyces TaxID=2593676 RepID=UPI002252F74A|nr:MULTISPECIES: serine hydrolase domain-containing protein [unclassified Streptomyces]MCX4880385.1 beta-lactamase family protein [Streptomyces sp. NBC_00847]MCX5047730.1 beta-lactamase family protein [Streptomyces sp. NBC_00474]MCX5057582.1 beta-lactamase family protein [Streptomyces sp. NBC_00452]MCX5245542.1 beta-lactamase family protein [Streptomyces sp. NBC_00201]
MPSLEQACERRGSRELSAPRLRRDTPERAGLDPGELRHLVQKVRDLSAGEHPWAAGTVVVAGRGPVIAVEDAAGWAVRYAAYDAETDRGIELPAEARVPMTVDTPFDLASLTKLFTAVAAVQQIERGTLGIDARVGAYLPEFRAAVRHRITVRELLTHTSGLRPELPLYDCADDTERLVKLRAEEPVGVPGTYTYSDLNLLLLQFVLERITGRTLDVLINDGITRPLGMLSTDFGPCPGAAATEDQRRPWAKVDRGMVRGVVHDENAWALGGIAGHAGMFSTGRDLAVFCRTLLAGGSHGPARILGSDFVELLLTPPGLGFAVDQPWFMGELAGRGAAGHTGFTGTSLVLDPATDTFLVLLANTVHPRRRAADSKPRAAAATRVARAVRPA